MKEAIDEDDVDVDPVVGKSPVVSWLVGGLEHLDYFPTYWE